jgi:hypothetical protein
MPRKSGSEPEIRDTKSGTGTDFQEVSMEFAAKRKSVPVPDFGL